MREERIKKNTPTSTHSTVYSVVDHSFAHLSESVTIEMPEFIKDLSFRRLVDSLKLTPKHRLVEFGGNQVFCFDR